MELFEPVPKKIKSSDKDQNILDQENEQLIFAFYTYNICHFIWYCLLLVIILYLYLFYN